MFLTCLSTLAISLATFSGSECTADVNGDQEVTALDIMHVTIELGTNNDQYDVNSDGIVNVYDILAVVSNLGNECTIRSKQISEFISNTPNNNLKK